MLRKVIFFLLGVFFLMAFAFLPWQEFLYLRKGASEQARETKAQLLDLAVKSLQAGDVPVGALLFYNDTLVGSGYNTVVKDSVAYGHAEINALNMAIKKYGVTRFFKLDRNKLELITTLEPCQMCKGAIIEYRIKNVRFMKAKDFSYWFEENRWNLLYQLKKSPVEGAALQDSLFGLHSKFEK